MAALLVAACSVAPPSSSPASSPTSGSWASQVGSTAVVPILASSELAEGKERFLFTLTDKAGQVVSDPSAAVHVGFFDLAKDPDHPASETDAPFFCPER